MEGVPRLYMIGLPAKLYYGRSQPDFAANINHEIRNSYDGDPSLYSSDVDAFNEIRQSAISALTSSTCTVDDCTSLKRYYVQLVRLVSKFPELQRLGRPEACDVTTGKPIVPLVFSWKRALGGKTKNITPETVDSGNIGYEMRCVLYNVGAAHSRLAVAQDRSPALTTSNSSTANGDETSSNTALKIACTHLQCAAWAFEQLLGGVEVYNNDCKWDHRDLPLISNRAVLEFAYNVTLAQAQECILEKSMMDGRKSLIIAKVSAMICDYFAGAIDAVHRVGLDGSYVSAKRLEKWRLYSEFKCRYYGAVTALFQGQHVQDQLQQMGTRVSYYRRAVNLLGRAGLISENDGKNVVATENDDDSTDDDSYYYFSLEDKHKGTYASAALKELDMRRETLSFSMDVAAAKWRAAKSENELIYHEPVIPVLSDDDDSDCLRSNPSSSTGGTNSRKLERVKGASLVKPIGFSIDDPELLAVVVANDKDSSNAGSVTPRSLFKGLIPDSTRALANIYRNQKNNANENIQSMCKTADEELAMFCKTLNLECLEVFNEPSSENRKYSTSDIPEQLINCCAAYQAQLQERQKEGEELTSDEEEDQIDIDMKKLRNAVLAVDGMLDEIDRHLKTEELRDNEYRRTVGRQYDYSTARMQELRREASIYREASSGRGRDSWLSLSRAIRHRWRQDLKMLALPMDELMARLPSSRPSKNALAAAVASDNIIVESPSPVEPSNQNDNLDSNVNKSERLQRLERESVKRLERLNFVVEKMHELVQQRQMLISSFRDAMVQEDKDVEGLDDLDVLGNLKICENDIATAIKKKLDDRYGRLVILIEQNVAAQSNILEAVRLAYAHAAPERRAYANAKQRRQNTVTSLLDAYDNYIVSIGGTPSEINNETETTLPNSGPLQDSALAKLCAKGLDFYQRLQVNVSKLLQRVKSACQVQAEQRDQIIKKLQEWEAGAPQQSDDEKSVTGGNLDNLLASVSGTVDNSDHHQEDLAALIENFGNSSALNKPAAPLGGAHWDQQLSHPRRLSPLGSEQQQHFHQYRYPQVNPLRSSTSTIAAEYYTYPYENQLTSSMLDNQDNGVNASIVQQQIQPTSVSSIATQATYPSGVAAYNLRGSTTVIAPINLTNTSLQSPMSSTPSFPYNYYNYQLPSVTSAVSPLLSSSSYSSLTTALAGSNEKTTTAMMNSLHLTNNNNDSQSYLSPYIRRSANSIGDDSSSGFTSAAAAVAVLQRPLQTPYTSIVGSSNDSEYTSSTGKFDYQHPSSILPSQLQQFYPQQYQQHISTTGTIPSGSIGTGITGGFTQPNQLIAGNGVTPASVQTPVPLSSTPTVTMNSTSLASAVTLQPSSINSSTSIATSFYHQPLLQQQQQQQLQSYQQQQPQLYQQQQQQQQQQSQLYQQHLQSQQQHQEPQQSQQQLPEPYQHQLQQVYQQPQPQQQPYQLANTSENIANNIFYSPLQQQYASQLHQSQQQLQSSVGQQAPAVANQQLTSMSSGGIGGCNYYPQYNQTMVNNSLSTPQTNHNNYYYQQPQTQTVVFDQHQQYYQQQQLPTTVGDNIAVVQSTPILNLLDDDQLLSGPPPIEPEKVSCIDAASSSPLSNSSIKN